MANGERYGSRHAAATQRYLWAGVRAAANVAACWASWACGIHTPPSADLFCCCHVADAGPTLHVLQQPNFLVLCMPLHMSASFCTLPQVGLRIMHRTTVQGQYVPRKQNDPRFQRHALQADEEEEQQGQRCC